MCSEVAKTAVLAPLPAVNKRVVALYTLAFLSTTLRFIAPLVVTLALKINPLVGIERATAAWRSWRDPRCVRPVATLAYVHSWEQPSCSPCVEHDGAGSLRRHGGRSRS